jgi:hypothetical protein
MSQPANSPIFAPSARCSASSGESFNIGETLGVADALVKGLMELLYGTRVPFSPPYVRLVPGHDPLNPAERDSSEHDRSLQSLTYR